jgi:hypothetical protein
MELRWAVGGNDCDELRPIEKGLCISQMLSQ